MKKEKEFDYDLNSMLRKSFRADKKHRNFNKKTYGFEELKQLTPADIVIPIFFVKKMSNYVIESSSKSRIQKLGISIEKEIKKAGDYGF